MPKRIHVLEKSLDDKIQELLGSGMSQVEAEKAAATWEAKKKWRKAWLEKTQGKVPAAAKDTNGKSTNGKGKVKAAGGKLGRPSGRTASALAALKVLKADRKAAATRVATIDKAISILS